mgnify:CR=1 FL=1
MEILIAVTLLVILAETSYLTYHITQKAFTSKGDVLLDTSVLIDGRILAIARSGLMSSRLIVTRSVIRELQFMADKADHDKRERARYGLEVIEKLQELPNLTVETREDGTTSEYGVDEQLIILAQTSGAKLCTIDYNLNKAARVQGVEIININELAHALRVIHLPGERIDVQLVQPGQDKKQAVGYLDDGTMVVVDDSRELIGQSVPVELTRVLQTTAGRMMFARRTAAKSSAERTNVEGKARGSVFASSKGDKTGGEAKGDKRRSEPKSLRRTAPADKTTSLVKKDETTDAPVVDQQPQAKPQQPAAPADRKPRRRQKRTAEDKLVDLANN